jgi:hypothetical protein
MLLAFLRFDGLEGLDINDSGSDDEDGPPDYPGKEPVEIVADCLTEIRKHSFQELGQIYDGGLFEALQKELVLTVPPSGPRKPRT